MSLRKSLQKSNDRPSTVEKELRENSVAFELYPVETKAESFQMERPDSLRRTADGGSQRLSTLSDMIQRYSVVPSKSHHTGRDSAAEGIEEIHRLQRMIGAQLPNVAYITLPSHLSQFFLPRKTLDEIKASLDSRRSTLSGDFSANWRPIESARMQVLLRDMALRKLQADTFKRLRITYCNHVALMEDVDQNLPHFPIFGWTLHDFLARRQERNTVWIDMLLHRSEKELEMLKFKCDMEEMCKLLKLIFQGLEPESEDAKSELYQYVHDTYEYLKFPQAFRIEAKQNMEKLREQINTYLDMWFYKRGSKEEAYKQSLEQKLMDIAVVGPIELRYEVNWMRTKTDQAIMKMTNALEEMEKKTENYRAEEAKESYCARCALDMYYLDIEKFKRRISELSAQYDTEFEKAENEIAYKKISMDKLRAQRKYLEEQIIRFQDEVDQMRQKELEEQMAEEEKRMEAELKALEAAQAKNKKKKGGKDKKKKK